MCRRSQWPRIQTVNGQIVVATALFHVYTFYVFSLFMLNDLFCTFFFSPQPLNNSIFFFGAIEIFIEIWITKSSAWKCNLSSDSQKRERDRAWHRNKRALKEMWKIIANSCRKITEKKLLLSCLSNVQSICKPWEKTLNWNHNTIINLFKLD